MSGKPSLAPWRGPAATALLLTLAACASAPGPAPAGPATELPARWQRAGSPDPATGAATGAAPAAAPAPSAALTNAAPAPASGATPDNAAADWWRPFGDADLDRLVALALRNNHELRIAQATLRQAQAARAATEAGARPQLGSAASANRSRSAGQSSTLYKLSLSAGWEPDFNGTQSAAQAAAQAQEQGAADDLARTRASLAAEVAIAYLNWRDAQARERLSRSSAGSLAQTLQLTTWRAQAGLDSALSLEQARLTHAQTEATLPALAAEVAQYEQQLALLCAEPDAATLIRQLAPERPVPEATAALAALRLGVPADLLRRRPDLRSAEAAVQAQWATREQTRRAGLPSVSLSGSLGWQAATLSALGGGGAGLASLAAGIDWTLWDGGQRRALVAQQDALLQARQLAYAAAVQAALKEVEDALAALAAQQARSATLARAAAAAEAAAQLSQVQRDAGLLGLDELLSAQRSALSARLSLQSARSAHSLALVQLFKALGGAPATADPLPPAAAPASTAPATASATAPAATATSGATDTASLAP